MLATARNSHRAAPSCNDGAPSLAGSNRARPGRSSRCRVAFSREHPSLHDQAHLAAECLVAKSHECVAQYQQHSSHTGSTAHSSLTTWHTQSTWSTASSHHSTQHKAQPLRAAAVARDSSNSSSSSARWPWSLWQDKSSASSNSTSSSSGNGRLTLLLEQSAAAVAQQHARRALAPPPAAAARQSAATGASASGATVAAAAAVAVAETATTTSLTSSYLQTLTTTSSSSSSSSSTGSTWEESAAALRPIYDSWEVDSDGGSSNSSAVDDRVQLFLYDLMPPAAAAAVAAEQPSGNTGSKLKLLLGDTYPAALSQLDLDTPRRTAERDSSEQLQADAPQQQGWPQQQQQRRRQQQRLPLQANSSGTPAVPEPSVARLQRAVREVGPLHPPSTRYGSSRSSSNSRGHTHNSSSSSSDDSDWLTAVLSAPTSRLSSHSNTVLTNSLKRLASLRNAAGGFAPGGSAAAAAAMEGPEGLLESIRSRFGSFQLQQFEEVALQLAQLGYRPDGDWLAAFESCSMSVMRGGSPRLLSRLLLSRSKLPGPVSREWCAACCEHMAAAPSKLSASSWVNALYALVRLKYTPNRHFQTTFFTASAERLDDVSPELLTHLVWSLARLRFSPSFMWWRNLVGATAGIEKPFSHAQLASLVHSVAIWAQPGGIAPQDVQRFVDLLLVEIHEHLGLLQPAELTSVVWSLGNLVAAGKLRPDQELQDELLSAMQGQLPRLSPVQCSNLCWGLAKLNHCLPEGFAEALLLEVQAQLSGFSNSNLCSVMWAVAKLELVPLAPFRQQLWEELQHRIKALVLPDLSTLLWALAQLQLQPPEDVLAELCEASLPHLSSCDVTHFTNIVWALGRLQARPGRDWVEAAEAASLQVLPTAGLSQVVNLAWGLSRLRLSSAAATTLGDSTRSDLGSDDEHSHGVSSHTLSLSMSGGAHSLSTAWQAACLRELRLRCMCAGHDVDCGQLVTMLTELGVAELAEGAAAAADKLFDEQEDEACCALQFQPGCR